MKILNYNKVEEKSDVTLYYLNGLFHRTDGPAMEWNDGDYSFYLYGESLPFTIWLKNLKIPTEEKIFLKLKYQPIQG